MFITTSIVFNLIDDLGEVVGTVKPEITYEVNSEAMTKYYNRLKESIVLPDGYTVTDMSKEGLEEYNKEDK